MMTAEQKSDIILLRSEGLTYSEIADRLELQSHRPLVGL